MAYKYKESVKCMGCGSRDLTVTHSSGGLQFCECNTCGNKFVVQADGDDLLDRYLTERAKIFSVIEMAKLNGANVERAKREMENLLASYAVLAEIDTVYYWYKIILLTNSFTDYSNLKSAEQEYLNIPKGLCYFLSAEDMMRCGKYEKQYAAYTEKDRKKNEKAADKKKKKRKVTLISLLCILVALLIGAVCFAGLYNPLLSDDVTGITMQTSIGANGFIDKFKIKMDAAQFSEEESDALYWDNGVTDDLSRFRAYRVRVLNGGVETQLKKALTVTVPAPEGYIINLLGVYLLTPKTSSGSEYKATELQYELIEDTNTLRFELPQTGIIVIGEKACIVSFDGEGVSIPNYKAEYGGTVAEPATPIRKGYTFDKWYLGTEEYDFTQKVQDSITITAHWIANKYKISYYCNGTLDSEQGVTFGEKFTIKDDLTSPVKGYTVQWYRDDLPMQNGVWQYDSDIVLEAHLIPKTYTIELRSGITSCCPAEITGDTSAMATYGQKLPELSILPEKTGYIFDGYYTEANGSGTKMYTENGSLASTAAWLQDEDSVFYANWTFESKFADYTLISQASDLSKVRDNPNEKFLLIHDIDLYGASWIPISDFGGIFDGGGHSIYNFTVTGGQINNTVEYVGFFSVLKTGGAIRNLQIGKEGYTTKIEYNKNHKRPYAGMVVGRLANIAVIENCRAVNCTVNTETYTGESSYKGWDWETFGGAIVGRSWGNIIGCSAIDCEVSVKATTRYNNIKAQPHAGGIVGGVDKDPDTPEVKDCLTKNCKITAFGVRMNGSTFNQTGDTTSHAGGIVGCAKDVIIVRCMSITCEILAKRDGSGTAYGGSILGFTQNTSPSDLVNVGIDLQASGSNANYEGCSKLTNDSYVEITSVVPSFMSSSYFVKGANGKIEHNFYAMARA